MQALASIAFSSSHRSPLTNYQSLRGRATILGKQQNRDDAKIAHKKLTGVLS